MWLRRSKGVFVRLQDLSQRCLWVGVYAVFTIFVPGNFTPGVTGVTAFVSVVCRFSSPLAA